VLSQAIDSLAVSFVFLAGTRPAGFIVANATNNYVGKLLMAILLTPLIYLGHRVMHRYLGLGEAPVPMATLARIPRKSRTLAKPAKAEPWGRIVHRSIER
jgi:queuosine precursor transporter